MRTSFCPPTRGGEDPITGGPSHNKMIESQPRLQSRNISFYHSNLPFSSTSPSSTSSPPTSSSTSAANENTRAVYLFVIIAFSYMIPWTAVGSLIDSYTNSYGKNYFVYLNLAFYGVGYPVSLLQQRIDLYYDIVYGSQQTFQGRLYVCLTLSMILLCCLPFLNSFLYILAIVGIGFTTWSAHGCASTLAGLIKFDSPILQQIGFVLPGIFSIIMIYSLDLKGEGEISLKKRFTFFLCACGCVFPGIIAWYFLCNSDLATNRFENKDKKMSLRIIQSARNDLKFKDFMIHYREIRASFIANGATSGQPLAPLPPSLMIVEDLAKERDSNGPDMERYSYTIGQKHIPMSSTFTNSPFLMQRNDFLPKASIKNIEEQDSSNESKSAPTMLYMNSELDKPLLSTKHATVLSTVPEQSDMSMSMNSMTMVQGLSSPPVTNSDPQHHGGIPNSLTISKDWTPSADILAHKIFMHDPTILSSAIDVDEILLKNQIHRLALFITMFCSILQAAFFSYLTNVSSNDNITLYLFFIRMFSDLLGRPLALIRPRIIFFQTIKGVLIGTIIRATFMFLFFFYIFTPKGLIYRNDYMILIFQGIYSMFSGYFGSLIYEYSACLYTEESHVIVAAQALSLIFQQACFSGMIVSATIALIFQFIT